VRSKAVTKYKSRCWEKMNMKVTKPKENKRYDYEKRNTIKKRKKR
jgi:hypothetical protein